MSWTAWIDAMLSNSCIEQAAIVGHDGSVWAASPDLAGLQGSEGVKLKDDSMSYFVCGKKYLKLKCDDGLIQMKEVGGSDGINHNMSVGRCKTCFVVLIGAKDTTGGPISMIADDYKKKLEGAGY